METIKVIILLFYLVFILFIVLFNWLYNARAIRANKQIGLYSPKYIKRLVRISSGLAVTTAVIIIFILVFKLY